MSINAKQIRQEQRKERDLLFLQHYGMTAAELLGQIENKEKENISLTEKLKETVLKYCNENQFLDIRKHIDIDVNATPKDLEEHKMTITLTALTELGADFIKDMQNAKIEYNIEISNNERN